MPAPHIRVIYHLFQARLHWCLHLAQFNLTEHWHERAVFQRSAFGRLTAGNDVVATKNIILFFFSFFSLFFLVFLFSPSSTFLIEEVLGSTNLFRKS